MHAHAEPNLNRAAVSATTHCLTGCAIGEVVGMAVSTALGWGNLANLVLAIALAFVFGYALTLSPVLRTGVSLGRATKITVASESVSITIMEAVDNGFVLVIPGALDAGLGDAKFWWSIALGFAIAYGPTWWANRALIARGKGHALTHQYHH